MNGKISVIERKGIKIHTYTSSQDGIFVNSQVIETGKRLVMVDTQLLRQHAKELKEYVERLGKPIDRVIITHSHPDHWFGLEYFEESSIYSLSETRKEIQKFGQTYIQAEKGFFGDAVTTRVILPEHEIKDGVEFIEGLRYEFEKVDDAEAGVQLLIKLPGLAAMIVQDIASNNVHLFIGEKAFDSWISVLKDMKNRKGYDTILVGHGENSDRSIFDKNIAYLEYAKKTFEAVDNGNDLKQQLIKKFPGFGAQVILDISNSFLYK